MKIEKLETRKDMQSSFVIELTISSCENISEQEKNLMRITDCSLEHQLKELQEKLDDMTNVYLQKSGRVAPEQANISHQMVELQDRMSFSDATLQTVDAEENEKEALPENSKGIDYVPCQFRAW